MSDIEADVTGGPDFAAIANEVVAAGAQGLQRGGEVIRARAAEIVHDERFNTGRLMGSIHAELLPPEGSRLIEEVSPGEPYAPFVEFNTIPHNAPPGPLILWAMTKVGRTGGLDAKAPKWVVDWMIASDTTGYASDSEVVNLAAFAWLAIRKHGTVGIHFMERAFEEDKDVAVALIDEAIGAVLDAHA